MDEISDPGDRAAFVCTLRTALQAYPGIAIVVTSREAGFRHVAAHLTPVCTQSTLSTFDADDIRRLSVAWHREVVGDSEKVRVDAEQLAATITQNDRINRLAVNPLLLTTLLLVKRWVGSLPTRRSVLYGKAVEVLLMTWNTEGHDPIPEEEALPQLCYVASAMMLSGVQKISRPRLASLLQEARDSLPTELGYVKGTVDEFIHRVEDRSSLLMMAGHDVEDGRLVEFFEFRHLTFQEFLTARAMVEGWHPGRKEDDTLSSVLEPHLVEEPWREVIPLAAVLGGKSTEVLIQTLTEYVGQITSNEAPLHNSIVNTLVNCLADEAAARPETIRAAIRALVRVGTTIASVSSTPILARGRYGPDLRDEAGRAFLSSAPIDADAADALTAAVFWQTLQSEDGVGYARAAEKFVSMLGASMVLTRCEGATALGRLCHELRTSENDDALTACVESLRRAGPILLTMTDGAPTECAASSFALAPIAYTRLWTPPADSDIYGRLFRLWQGHDDPTVRRLAAHALASQAPLLVNERPICASIPFSEVEDLMRRYDEPKESYEQPAVLFLAWCLRALDDTEIAKRASTLVQYRSHNVMGRTLRELSEHLNGPHSTDY